MTTWKTVTQYLALLSQLALYVIVYFLFKRNDRLREDIRRGEMCRLLGRWPKNLEERISAAALEMEVYGNLKVDWGKVGPQGDRAPQGPPLDPRGAGKGEGKA